MTTPLARAIVMAAAKNHTRTFDQLCAAMVDTAQPQALDRILRDMESFPQMHDEALPRDFVDNDWDGLS